MKTNAQLLDEITAAMADAWLAACDRHVIGTTSENKHVVFRYSRKVGLFGPASGDEYRLFIHRLAALDVLRVLGLSVWRPLPSWRRPTAGRARWPIDKE
jgi:hypothetical protein